MNYNSGLTAGLIPTPTEEEHVGRRDEVWNR
jgi:hypothetical protein